MAKKNKLTSNNTLPPPTPIDVPPTPKQTYALISIANDVSSFTRKIDEYLAGGWQLQGGVSTNHVATDYNVSIVYTQAVVKYL